MKLTSKGQVTIPIEVREQLGLRPGDEVQFVVDVSTRCAHLVKVEGVSSRGRHVVDRLRGTATANTEMSTDELMALMRGD